MGTNSEYVTLMQSQLKKWDNEVDVLSAMGKTASMEARSAYQEGMKELRASRGKRNGHSSRFASRRKPPANRCRPA